MHIKTESLLLHPCFFAPVSQYVLIANAGHVIFEREDNYQKQTYRNRCYIYGPNGRQLLTVPVKHTKGSGRQKTKEVRIDNSFSWQKIIVKSLEAAYRSSPFFEFYEDEVLQVFQKRYEFLMDLNLHAMEVTNDCLQLDRPYSFTENYREKMREVRDFRHLVDAKSKQAFSLRAYRQVFDSKHGYLADLSILDLLFNEGTQALSYLEEHASLFS